MVNGILRELEIVTISTQYSDQQCNSYSREVEAVITTRLKMRHEHFYNGEGRRLENSKVYSEVSLKRYLY